MENLDQIALWGMGMVASALTLFLKREVRKFEDSPESLGNIRAYHMLDRLLYKELEKAGYRFGPR